MDIFDLEEESRTQGGAQSRLYEQVGLLARQHGLGGGKLGPWTLLGPRAPQDAISIHEVVRQVHAIEPSFRRQHPSLFLYAGLLAGHAGDWNDGVDMLGDVARCGSPSSDQPAVWEGILRLSLESGLFDQARLAHNRLRELSAAHPEVCPQDLDVVDCLVADLTGVIWLVRDRATGLKRTLHMVRLDHVDQAALMLLVHGTALGTKDHPAAERIVRQGEIEGTGRFYRLTEPWQGHSLSTEIALRGPLPLAEVAGLAWTLVSGVQSMHRRGSLHRSVMPDRVMVWRENANEEIPGPWRCRVIGSDLVPKKAVLHAWTSRVGFPESSATEDSARQYARWLPSETQGRPKGVIWQGPIQDVYGIGRTILFALTGGDRLRGTIWDSLPQDWRDLIADAGAWLQNKRIATVEELAVRLAVIIGPEERARLDAEILKWRQEELEVIVREEPDNAEVYRSIGRFHQGKDDLPAAIKSYCRAIELDDTDAATRVGRSQCYVQCNRPDLGEIDLRRARELEPERTPVLVGLVGLLRIMGRETEALALLDDAISKNGRDFSLHMERGLTLRVLERHEGAEESFAQAGQIQPDSPYPAIFRGRALVMAGRYHQALKVLEQVVPMSILMVDDEKAALFLDLARVKLELGQLEEALNAANEAKEAADASDNRSLKARSKLAQINAFVQLNKLDEAIECLQLVCPTVDEWISPEKALHAANDSGASFDALMNAMDALLAKRPDQAGLRRFQAMARLGMFRDGRGKKMVHEIIEGILKEGAPEMLPPTVVMALVQLLQVQARFDEALNVVERRMATHPDEADWHQERQRILAKLGRQAEALKGCNDIYDRANVFLAAGQRAELLSMLEKAVAASPRDERLATTWGDALAACGQWERARGAYEAAMRLQPEQIGPRIAMATTLNALGRGDLALKRCQPPEIAMADTQWVPVLLESLIQAGHWREAADLIDRAEKDGADPVWLAGRGIALMKAQGDVEGARELLYRTVNLSHGDPRMLEIQADLEAADGHASHALCLVERVLKVWPDRATNLSRKALLLAQLLRWQEALALQESGVAEAPLNPLPLNNLAWMLAVAPAESGGDTGRALVLAEEACRLTLGENPNMLDTLAEAAAACGDTKRACTLLERAMELKSAQPRPNSSGGATLDAMRQRLERIHALEDANKEQSL